METFQDLLQRIENKRREIGVSKSPAWYRGHRLKTYSLIPTLLRLKNGEKHEVNLFNYFGVEAAGLLDQGSHSWERLAIMQHYGMPTRLLDWTASIHTALFFATAFKLTKKVGKPSIWILNPYRLNKQATKIGKIFNNDSNPPPDYREKLVKQDWPYDLPVALSTLMRNERVAAQRGHFTFHGNDTRPLDEITKDCAVEVKIPPHLVRSVIRNLKASSTDHFRMFPDLNGLSMKLKRQFSLY